MARSRRAKRFPSIRQPHAKYCCAIANSCTPCIGNVHQSHAIHAIGIEKLRPLRSPIGVRIRLSRSRRGELRGPKWSQDYRRDDWLLADRLYVQAERLECVWSDAHILVQQLRLCRWFGQLVATGAYARGQMSIYVKRAGISALHGQMRRARRPYCCILAPILSQRSRKAAPQSHSRPSYSMPDSLSILDLLERLQFRRSRKTVQAQQKRNLR